MTDSRVLCLWKRAWLFTSEDKYTRFRSFFLSEYLFLSKYFLYLVILFVFKHIDTIVCIKNRFILSLLSLTVVIIYNGEIIKHSSEL